MSRPVIQRATFAAQLRALGVKPGMTLMVHASLSRVGWLEHGAQTAIDALMDVLGQTGTLVMPAASSAPSELEIDSFDVQALADKERRPTTMGALADAFRVRPGTLRSDNPFESVCANGAKAESIVSEHPTEFCEGRGGPYEKLYDLGGYTLLLGVGFNRCTSLHFAESLSERRRTICHRIPIWEEGQPRWITVRDRAADNSTHVPIVGAQFVTSGAAQQGKLGAADSYLFATRDLVDFATPYFDENLPAPP